MGKPKRPEFLRMDDPPPMGDVLHIDRVGIGQFLTGVIISPSMAGWPTHWYMKRTRPCIGPKNGCVCAEKPLAYRWVGMVQWIRSDVTNPSILELTQLAGNRLKSILAKTGTLRGLRIEVHRERANLRSPIAISLLGNADHPDRLPSEKDYRPTLERLWGTNW